MAYDHPSPNSFRKVIHDLNSSIFIIRGNTEMALDPDATDGQTTRSLKEIKKAVEEIEPIVKRLRAKQKELAPDE